jgi:hypothetical protein
MDLVPEADLETWDYLSWEHLPNPEAVTYIDTKADVEVADLTERAITWGTNAAHMAYILHQKPVMVAVHASMMLEGLPHG